MSHPLIPQILDLASPVAQELGLEAVAVVFQTNKRPPVLRVDIRNCQTDTSLEDCERMSRALDAALDQAQLLPDAYVLEVSSPGISRQLTTDREFISFRGFVVTVSTHELYQGHQLWQGNLTGRDETEIHLSQKGKAIAIPRDLVSKVQLDQEH